MKSIGICIEDVKESNSSLQPMSLELTDILNEIYDGESYFWLIVDIDAYYYKKVDSKLPDSYLDLRDQINKSNTGLRISWNDLKVFQKNFQQIVDLTVIGSKDESKLRSYNTAQEMFETCDIVISTIDNAYWDIFTKDQSLIDRFTNKFKMVSPLQTDFMEQK